MSERGGNQVGVGSTSGQQADRFSEPPNSTVCAYDALAPGCISLNSGWGVIADNKNLKDFIIIQSVLREMLKGILQKEEKNQTGINFYVIVLLFLTAIESEFLWDLPYEVELVPQEEYRHDFCYSIAECRVAFPQAMDAAKRLYEYFQSREIVAVKRDIPKYNIDEDTAILYMWEAHQASIDIGTSKFDDISFYSSKTERDFTLDFLLSIEFAEAALYRPYFESSAKFLVGFPYRPLIDQDRDILTTDFNIREKALLILVKLISEINTITGGKFFTIWNKAMNLELVRVIGRNLLKLLLLIPSP
ncbi:protein LEG1 homolog [Saccopteryx bilineata]|uniref:protein LEG1 homolog n=1 Tax=Saccopteryx bilineata TaxID=59482 RepID=UPI00338D42E3